MAKQILFWDTKTYLWNLRNEGIECEEQFSIYQSYCIKFVEVFGLSVEKQYGKDIINY